LTTIYSIIKVYTKENRIEAKLKRGDRNKVVSAQQIDALKCWIEEDCNIPLDSMRRKLKKLVA